MLKMADSGNSSALLLNVSEDAEQAAKQIKRCMVSDDLATISDVKSSSTDQLVEGILERDKEIKRLISMVQVQGQDQKKCEETRAVIVQKTKELRQLQTHLREAEKILEQSLYEARQKLDGIKRASNGIISSEELIAYGHKLSMANVTSPPVDWMPGDGRRPYPTDIEMRCGSLSRLNRDTSSDRVSEVSKPDVAMETDQPLQESEVTAWKVPAGLESLLGKAPSNSFSDHPTNDVMALTNGENSPQADSNSSDSSPSSSSSDEG